MKNIIIKSCSKYLLPILAIIFSVNAHSQEAVIEKKKVVLENKVVKTDFIRVAEKGKHVKLQTSVTRYTKNGVNVDLIGAVHVADKQYFTDLNKLFKKFDVLLFEMVGGDKMVKGKMPVAGKQKSAQFSFLNVMYNSMQKRLNLSGQKEHIDYSKENFVHADLSIEEFQKLQKEKKESLLTFAIESAVSQANLDKKKKYPQPSTFQLLKALIMGDADLLKLNIVHTLGQGDDQIAALSGNNVIIGDRNIKCLKVMNDQIAAGKTNIGIFYGAAHFPDMEKKMLKMGFRKTNQFWMTAWNIKKK